MSARLLGWRCWLLGCLVVWSGGCGPAEPQGLEFPVRAEVKQLAPSVQKQVAKVLEEHFGTPEAPRFQLPVAEGADELLWGDRVAPDRLAEGMQVFRRYCAGCHGPFGDGAGPAAPYLLPKPRDYRLGVFKFTSTPYGSKPRRQDLIRTIRFGAKGTSMPAFKWLPPEQLEPLVDYVIMLSCRGELEYRLARIGADYQEGEEIEPEVIWEEANGIREAWERAATEVVLPLTPRPPYTRESVELGRKAFLENECFKCHGRDGRGQTAWLDPRFLQRQQQLPESRREPINYDAWGQIAPAADLTAGMLHGGRRPIDIYRRIYSGINGTPMPSFAQKFSDQPDTIWHLVHFILYLTEGGKVASSPAE